MRSFNVLLFCVLLVLHNVRSNEFDIEERWSIGGIMDRIRKDINIGIDKVDESILYIRNAVNERIESLRDSLEKTLTEIDQRADALVRNVQETVKKVDDASPCIRDRREEAREAVKKITKDAISSLRILINSTLDQFKNIRKESVTIGEETLKQAEKIVEGFGTCLRNRTRLRECLTNAFTGAIELSRNLSSNTLRIVSKAANLTTSTFTDAGKIVARAVEDRNAIKKKLNSGVESCFNS